MTEQDKKAFIEVATMMCAQEELSGHVDADVGEVIKGLAKIALASLTAPPVLFALRFKNLNGQPEKLINDNCLFRSREKASQYAKGGNYITQSDGRIEWVANPSLDPEVVPLYTTTYEVEE